MYMPLNQKPLRRRILRLIFAMILGSNSAFEFPTLLHLAANFGFSEFATRLIDLPDAQTACIVRNSAGKIPETMAKENSYDDLASLFQDYRLIVITTALRLLLTMLCGSY